jgi:hypothetical protein
MQGPTWTEKQRAARLDALVTRNRAGRQGAFLYEDADWMRDAYVTRGLTLRQMAREASCGLRTIARWMRTHGIETRTEWAHPSGPDHPNWTGGPPPCPRCGGPKAHNAATCADCRDRAAERNPKWRGDEIEYTAAHARVVAQRGKPDEYPCAHCGGQATEWAYDHSDPNELRNHTGRDDGPFSLDAQRYMPLCVPCHRRFDLGA